jgi:hypothetical protein
VQGAQADLQAQFSVAYVQAVASVAGFYVQIADRVVDATSLNGRITLSYAGSAPGI